jgi:Pvc16 N-terminal domain
MSTPLALATVTAVLQNFIQNSITDHDLAATLGADVTVSAEPPDRIDNGASSPDRINLFLFQATENQGWRNVGLPSRNLNGDRISNPSLALDLSYLLTAYGSGPLHAEALLGFAMFVLHEMPVLTRDAIRAVAVAPPQPLLLAGLQASQLADQIEQIKIAPQVMSVEEISKIWSALQSQYRPTAVYKASVVLVESQRSIRPTLPVRARNLRVIPFDRPVIEFLQSQENNAAPIVPDQPILAGYNLIIEGHRLRGEITVVLVDDDHEITPNDDQISPSRIIVALPLDLQPGLHAVQVAHRVAFDPAAPNDTRRGLESNVTAFLLVPEIVASPPAAARGSVAGLTINPAVGPTQRATLLVGRGTIPIPARPPGDPPSTTLEFTVPEDFFTGADQLLRVQIDGAESPLVADANGLYVDPRIEIIP